MLDFNTFIVIAVAVVLVTVGVLAWIVDAGVADKNKGMIKYGLFGLFAGLLGLFFMIDDDTELEYAEWQPKGTDTARSDRGGGGGGGGGGGNAALSGGEGGDGEISLDEGGDTSGGDGKIGMAASDDEGGFGEEPIDIVEEIEPGIGKVESDCDHCPDIVIIGPGMALIGSPLTVVSGGAKTGPASRAVFSQSFGIGKTEVTVGQYQAFVKATGYKPTNSCRIAGTNRRGVSYMQPGFPQTDDHPVVCVSWLDAKHYTDWLSGQTGRKYRLPTEVEWEYAARAGMTTAYLTGSQVSSKHANFKDKRGERVSRTLPVASFAANGNGLHDVHGNAWEFTEDCWSKNYQIASSDRPHGVPIDCSRRIVKGGAWFSNAQQLDLAIRASVKSDYANNGVGFRVVREEKVKVAKTQDENAKADADAKPGDKPTGETGGEKTAETLEKMTKGGELLRNLRVQ